MQLEWAKDTEEEKDGTTWLELFILFHGRQEHPKKTKALERVVTQRQEQMARDEQVKARALQEHPEHCTKRHGRCPSPLASRSASPSRACVAPPKA